MGVPGLFTYIQGYVDCALEWHKLYNCKLVIDGNNMAHEIFSNCKDLNPLCGSDLYKFELTIEDTFKKFLKCNVKPYVVMDGGHPVLRDKFHTLCTRYTNQTKLSVVASSSSNKRVPGVFPVCGFSVFARAIQKMGIPLVQCDFEADDDIAVVAKKLDAIVLSNDSDFYLFGTPFVVLNSLNMKRVMKQKFDDGQVGYYIACYKFNPEMFCKVTGVAIEHLPLLAPILGNDFLDDQMSRIVQSYMNVSMPRSAAISTRHRSIIGVVKWLSNQTGTPSEILDQVLNNLPEKLMPRGKRELFHAALSMYYPNHSLLSSWFSLHKPTCPAKNLSSTKSVKLCFSKLKFQTSGFVPLNLKKELICECEDRSVSKILQSVNFPSWFVKSFRLFYIWPMLADLINLDYLILLPQVEVKSLPSVYVPFVSVINQIRGIIWCSVAQSRYSQFPIIKTNSFLSNNTTSQLPKVKYLPQAVNNLSLNGNSSKAKETKVPTEIDFEDDVDVLIEEEVEEFENEVLPEGSVNSSKEDKVADELETEKLILSPENKDCEDLSGRISPSTDTTSVSSLTYESCHSDMEFDFNESEPLSEFKALKCNVEENSVMDSVSQISMNFQASESSDDLANVLESDIEDKCSFNKHNFTISASETDLSGAFEDTEYMNDNDTCLEPTISSNNLKREIVDKDSLHENTVRPLSKPYVRKKRKKDKSSQQEGETSEPQNIFKIRNDFQYKKFLETRSLPNMKLYMRREDWLWGKELGSLDIRNFNQLATLYEVERLSLSEKQSLFLHMCNVHFKFEEGIPANIEFILYCICFWKTEFHHLKEETYVWVALMCIIMFSVINEKIGKKGVTKGDRKGFVIDNIQKQLASLQLRDPNSLSISELVDDLTEEECVWAKLSLLQFILPNNHFQQKSFDRKLCHSFSGYQVTVYFFQLINSLLCFPFPHMEIHEIFAGTFASNLFNMFSSSKFPLNDVLNVVFYQNSRLFYLFSKLYDVLKGPLQLTHELSYNDLKYTDYAGISKKLGLTATAAVQISMRGESKAPEKKLKKKKVGKIKCDKISNKVSGEQLALLSENKFSALFINVK